MPILHRLHGQRCLCRGCDQIFSNPGNFDRHRKNLNCRPPASEGLVQAAGIWKRPDTRPTQAPARIYAPVPAPRVA